MYVMIIAVLSWTLKDGLPDVHVIFLSQCTKEGFSFQDAILRMIQGEAFRIMGHFQADRLEIETGDGIAQHKADTRHISLKGP